MRAILAMALPLLATGCGGGPAPEAPAPPAPPAAPPAPADTLVLSTRSGYEIWLAEGRTATGEDGATCFERSVEIRRDGDRRRVPLLFVSTPPTELDRDHIQADLSRDCRATDRYRVELATGRPIRIGVR